MRELIDRLEKAPGPDLQLDGDIAERLGLPPPDYVRWTTNRMPGRWQKNVMCWDAPDYTASIDAALTLVPTGQPWLVGVNQCWAWTNFMATVWDLSKGQGAIGGHVDRAETPAIALCIPALKAREPR